MHVQLTWLCHWACEGCCCWGLCRDEPLEGMFHAPRNKKDCVVYGMGIAGDSSFERLARLHDMSPRRAPVHPPMDASAASV